MKNINTADGGLKEDIKLSEKINEMRERSKENNAREEAIIDQAVKKILDERDPEYIKKIVRDASRQILDRFVEMKLCPLMTNPSWTNCGDLEKGKEEFCAGGKFVNCPAFDRYVTHEIIARPQRKKRKKFKNKEDKKEGSK